MQLVCKEALDHCCGVDGGRVEKRVLREWHNTLLGVNHGNQLTVVISLSVKEGPIPLRVQYFKCNFVFFRTAALM